MVYDSHSNDISQYIDHSMEPITERGGRKEGEGERKREEWGGRAERERGKRREKKEEGGEVSDLISLYTTSISLPFHALTNPFPQVTPGRSLIG